MIKLNDVYIKCNKCSKLIKIDADNFDSYTSAYERNMGPETEYEFSHECVCEKCGENITISIRAYEYPQGAFNYMSSDIKGASFTVEPSAEVEFEEEFYFDEEERKRLLNPVEELKRNIKNMEPREFELYISSFFEHQGFETFVTNPTRDGGFDVLCKKSNPYKLVLLVECKHYDEKNVVGVEIVRSMLGVHYSNKVNKSIIITTSSFSTPAKQFADEQKTLIDLVDFDGLISWIKKENF